MLRIDCRETARKQESLNVRSVSSKNSAAWFSGMPWTVLSNELRETVH